LSRARAAEDDLRVQVVSSNVEFRWFAVVRPNPAPKAREPLGHHLQEGAPVNRVESVLGVKGDVYPRWILVEDGSDGMRRKLEA
jgi:hypothetical protein